MDNRTTLSPDTGGTPEFDAQVDQLFASAMAQQLEEQRALSRLASRVEHALRELQRGIDSLSQYVNVAATQAGADASEADSVALEKLTRLTEDSLRQGAEVREGLGRLADQLDLAGLRSEIAQLAARIEQRTTPLPEAIGEVRGALSNLGARIERSAQPQAALASALTSISERLEALSGDQDEVVRSLESAQRTLSEQGARLETLRDTVQAQAGHAGDRVAALLDQATAKQRELLAELGSVTTKLAAEASSTRDAVRGESEQLRDTLAEALAVARAGLSQTVSAARTICDQVTASGGAAHDAVERMQSLVEALATRLEETQAQGNRRLSQAAAVLEQAAQGLEPSVLAAVEGLRQAVLDTAAAARAQSESMTATLRGVAAGTVQELRGLVEEAAQRMLDAQTAGTLQLTEAATSLVCAADDLQPTFSSAFAKLYGAVAAVATQVRATSEEAAARSEARLTESLRDVEVTIADRLSESDAATQAAASRLERAAGMLQEQGAALRPALTDAVDELRRLLREASAEDRVRADASLSVIQRAAEGAAGEMGTAVNAAVERLSTAIVEAANRAAEQQGADTSVLADAADHVARTAESLAPAVAAALARVDGAVAQAVTSVETALGERLAQSETAAQAAARDLQTAASDAGDRLRVWLAGTLPDAVARITSDLGEQLERVEARVEETATKIQTMWAEVGGGLQTTADAAGTRMAEAARALTAVAGSTVDGAERQLQMLTEQIDALVVRLDGVTDVEVRRADATEEILTLLRRAEGGVDASQAPGQLVPAPATGGVVDLSPRAEAALALVTERFEAVLAELQSLRTDAGDTGPIVLPPHKPRPGLLRDIDTVAIQLEDTLEQAEDLEQRLSERIEEATLRLDEACGSLVRLESQLVAYLRERDRMAFEERGQLVADLAERLGAVTTRKDGSRLLGGLLPGSGRRRDTEPPPLSPPVRPLPTRSPQPAVRPPGQPPQAGGPLRDNPLSPEEGAPPRRGTQQLATCDVCGFIARSPGGLAAHRRTHD